MFSQRMLGLGRGLDSFEDITHKLEHSKKLCMCLNLHVAPQLSATGIRNWVARVMAGCPNHLDCSGVVFKNVNLAKPFMSFEHDSSHR